MRTFGVEEELLLVDAATCEPLPAGAWATNLHAQTTEAGHELTAELQQEQIEVNCPPQTTLAEQLAAIRSGRALADEAATRVGGRVVALPTAPGPVIPHLVPDRRYHRISERFGITATEQLTCGFHVHVAVQNRQEGVAVLDRIRVWLPVLLALSANSPFWHGTDTGYASYRYQVWSRWPTAGPTEVFGSSEDYDRYTQGLLATGVPLDAGMLYFDARLSEHHPTVEVRVADVCLEAEHAAVLAALIRALVETAARQWTASIPPPPVPVGLLTAWTWRASHAGPERQLIDPHTSTPVPAGDVVAHLLELLHPVLTECGEAEQVEAVVADILRNGSGARRQRQAHRQRGTLRAVVQDAIKATHQPPDAPTQTPAASTF